MHSHTENLTAEQKLKSILEKYQREYKSDPNALRNAIPKHEIWRYFIDGELLTP